MPRVRSRIRLRFEFAEPADCTRRHLASEEIGIDQCDLKKLNPGEQ